MTQPFVNPLFSEALRLSTAGGHAGDHGGAAPVPTGAFSPVETALHYDLVRRSGLFDEEYYRAQFPDERGQAADWLAHYLQEGGFSGRNPNWLFDSAWYLARHPGARMSGLNPLVHFLLRGCAQGLSPAPLFDVEWYRRSYGHIDFTAINPLTHFLREGDFCGFSPHPLVNAAWYLGENPEVGAVGGSALRHWLSEGVHNGCDPHPMFMSRWYMDQYPDVERAGMNPLVHFVNSAPDDCLDPNPLFQSRWYREVYATQIDRSVLAIIDYVTGGSVQGREGNGVQQSPWYYTLHPSVAIAGMDALAHYLRYGSTEQVDPAPGFWTRYYAARYAGQIGTMLPLEHFLKVGNALGNATVDDNSAYHRQVQDAMMLGAMELPEIVRHIAVMPLRPTFTILTRTARAGRELLQSIKSQVYQDWTLVDLDDADALAAIGDRPLHYVLRLEDTLRLHPLALYSFASALNVDPALDLIYSDEDRVVASGERRSPFFKPGWSPDYLESIDYIGESACLRATVALPHLKEVSGAYDLTLRVTEKPVRVLHIARVLFHMRDRFEPDDAGIARDVAALADRMARTGRTASIEPRPEARCYEVRASGANPSDVSVVIPTAGKFVTIEGRALDLIVNCVRTISPALGPDPEIIVVHNGDLHPRTARALEAMRCRLVLYDAPAFNVAEKLNLGARHATRDGLLLLNDDIQPITPDWLDLIQGHLAKPHVGVVGAKLLYPDKTTQHAGVVTNSGNPDHVFRGQPDTAEGYFYSASLPRNFTAVTGACMLTRRQIYLDVGGYTEELAVSYNDIDFCLKVEKLGYFSMLEPRAQLHHFESVSRVASLEMTESEFFHERWASRVIEDPYYSEDYLDVRPPHFRVKFNRSLRV